MVENSSQKKSNVIIGGPLFKKGVECILMMPNVINLICIELRRLLHKDSYYIKSQLSELPNMPYVHDIFTTCTTVIALNNKVHDHFTSDIERG